VYDEHVRPSYRERTTSYQVPHPDVKSHAAPTDMEPYKPPILVVRADTSNIREHMFMVRRNVVFINNLKGAENITQQTLHPKHQNFKDISNQNL
jgi:hypothetical protein